MCDKRLKLDLEGENRERLPEISARTHESRPCSSGRGTQLEDHETEKETKKEIVRKWKKALLEEVDEADLPYAWFLYCKSGAIDLDEDYQNFLRKVRDNCKNARPGTVGAYIYDMLSARLGK